MTIWICTRCGSPNGSITEMCFRCGAPSPGQPGPGVPSPGQPGPGAPVAPGTGTDEPSLVPLARYDVLPPTGSPHTEQPAYPQPQPGYGPAEGYQQPMPVPVTPAYGPPGGPPPGYAPQPQAVPYEQPPHYEQPPPYEQQYAAPPPPAGQERRWWVPVLVGVVVLLAIGAVTTVLLVGRGGDDEPTGSPSATSTPGDPPSTGPSTAAPGSASPTVPGSVGVVAIDPAVTDPRAAEVATMFDSHFAAVNAKDYTKALAAYDPAGVINPNDPNQAADFQRAVSTTTDEQITLRSVGPDSTGRGVLAARVTFRSSQQAGYGPRERPNETCTAWDVTYTLSQPAGAYKILAGKAVNAPC
jgi:hypothetical protein